MSLYQQAIASRRAELLASLAEMEREQATLELAYSHADDADRETIEARIGEVTDAIQETAATLDEIDEAGFWRDR